MPKDTPPSVIYGPPSKVNYTGTLPPKQATTISGNVIRPRISAKTNAPIPSPNAGIRARYAANPDAFRARSQVRDRQSPYFRRDMTP